MAIEYYSDAEYWERLDGVDHPKVSSKRTHSMVQESFPPHTRWLVFAVAEVFAELAG